MEAGDEAGDGQRWDRRHVAERRLMPAMQFEAMSSAPHQSWQSDYTKVHFAFSATTERYSSRGFQAARPRWIQRHPSSPGSLYSPGSHAEMDGQPASAVVVGPGEPWADGPDAAQSSAAKDIVFGSVRIPSVRIHLCVLMLRSRWADRGHDLQAV